MCFAPQRRALFRHLNVKKWSEHVMFLPFWLGNVLCATTACTFSTSQLPRVVREVLRATTACIFSTPQLPKVVRDRQFLTLLPWKCASPHNEAHSWATNHQKNRVNLDFPTFSRTCSFFLLPFSLLWSSHFCSSPPWLFPPLRFHLTSKLPSTSYWVVCWQGCEDELRFLCLMIFDLCWVSSIGDDVSITPRSSRKFLNSGKLCSSLSLGDSRLEIPAGPMLVFHTRLMMHII